MDVAADLHARVELRVVELDLELQFEVGVIALAEERIGAPLDGRADDRPVLDLVGSVAAPHRPPGERLAVEERHPAVRVVCDGGRRRGDENDQDGRQDGPRMRAHG